MEELRKFQSSTFDTIARRKLVEVQNTILELSGRIQELQNGIFCMSDSKEFQDAEPIRSGNSHVTSRPVSFPPHPIPEGMLSRSFGVPSRREGPPSIWDTHRISGNVFFFANPDASLSAPYPQELNQWSSSIEEPLHQDDLTFCGESFETLDQCAFAAEIMALGDVAECAASHTVWAKDTSDSVTNGFYLGAVSALRKRRCDHSAQACPMREAQREDLQGVDRPRGQGSLGGSRCGSEVVCGSAGQSLRTVRATSAPAQDGTGVEIVVFHPLVCRSFAMSLLGLKGTSVTTVSRGWTELDSFVGHFAD